MENKPNIVFILNDHQAYYGHGDNGGVKPLRPNFEAFANSGIEFTNGYCVTPMCGPARRSLLTGLYPHTHGQIHNENDPPYDHEVYLNSLAKKGYKNFYYGKWHAGPGCAYDHNCEGLSMTGYGNPYTTEEYADYLSRKNLPKAQHKIKRVFTVDDFDKKNYFPKLKEGALYSSEDFWCGEHAVGETVTPKETHEAFFLADLACEKLEELAQREGNEPFTLRVDFWGPHQPFFPTKEFLDMYTPEEIQEYPSFNHPLLDKPHTYKSESNRPIGDGAEIIYPNPIPWSEWQKMLAHCYAHSTMIDAAGGMVIDKLKELGLDENTLIIWSTDHGDAIASHGGHFDKDSHMAEEVMRIPLAMSYKEHIKPGQKSDELVFTCDIPVTMMAAANSEFSNRVDGSNLLELATQDNAPWRKSLMCETHGHGYGTYIPGRMIVDKEFKYASTINDKEELYNLVEDPYQLKNLAFDENYNDIKEKMKDLLREKQAESMDNILLDELLCEQ